MIRVLSRRLVEISNGKVALAGIIVFLLFTILVLPAQSQQAEAAINEAGSPDLSLFYSPDELYQMAEAYGEAGRKEYIQARFSFDLVWPLVYAFFLCTTISWVFSQAFAASSSWRLANLAPLAGLLFDYLENFSTSLVMLRYPIHTGILEWLAPGFTFLKWIFVGGSFGLLILGSLIAGWVWLRKGGRLA